MKRLLTAGLALGLLLLAAAPAPAAGPDLLTWGRNNQGQLGDGTTTNRTTPVFPTLAPGTTVTQIAAGDEDTSFAVLSTGVAVAWGNNGSGQLGDGTTTNRLLPVTSVFPPGTLITHVTAGRNHTVWLTSTGLLYAAGFNAQGQIGDGTVTTRTTPVLVDLPLGTTISAVEAGWDHTIALTSAGDVLAWGYNGRGNLGDGTSTNRTTPVAPDLPPSTTGSAVAAGGNHSYVLDSSAAGIFSFGQGTEGQLGRGSLLDSTTPVNVTLPGGTTITDIDAGTNHGLAVTSTGTVLAYGLNDQGQLSDGTTTNRTTPVTATLPPGTVATAVSGGQRHSLFLTTGGKVLASGRNIEGQLGDGTTTQRTTAVASLVGAGSTMNLISGGAFHSMAVGTFSLTGVPVANVAVVALVLLVTTAGGTAWVYRKRRVTGGLPA